MNETIAQLAKRLLAADTKGWTEAGARALAAAIGPDARLRPVGQYEERYVDGEAYVGLAVPLQKPAEAGPAAQAAAFAEAREELTAELGEASIMGVYGDLGPFYDSGPLWGTPYLRWRGRPNTLELRAGTAGPELVLQPTDPVESWFWRQGHGEEHAITGFFGSTRGPANAGLGFPGGWRAQRWETVTRALADFLSTLPAETTALGASISMPIYGRGAGQGAPLLFEIACSDRLEITCFPPSDDEWHIDAGGPGEPRGHELAETMVSAARAAGVRDPQDLIVGGEAEYMSPYHVTFYGLGLPTG